MRFYLKFIYSYAVKHLKIYLYILYCCDFLANNHKNNPFPLHIKLTINSVLF